MTYDSIRATERLSSMYVSLQLHQTTHINPQINAILRTVKAELEIALLDLSRLPD